jgi:predicted enzyme related to lactoylglutathione lyase
MKVHRIAWLGIRTDNGPAMAEFLEQTLDLELDHADHGVWVFNLPEGGKVEVFGSRSQANRHFVTGPVAGFLVDDVRAAAEELQASGAAILHGPAFADEDDAAWVHFRAPDGNIYELTQGRDLEPLG